MLELLQLIAALLCAIIAAIGLILFNLRKADGTLSSTASNSGLALILAALIGGFTILYLNQRLADASEQAEYQQMITDLDNAAKGY